MTNVRNCLALGVTMAFAIVSGAAFAQDDLDDLLKDLEGTAAKPAEEAKPADAAAKSADATESADATSSSRQETEVSSDSEKRDEDVASAKEDVAPAEEAKPADAAAKPADVAEPADATSAPRQEGQASASTEKRDEDVASAKEDAAPAKEDTVKKVDEVMSLLDELAAEDGELPMSMQVGGADARARAAKASAPAAAEAPASKLASTEAAPQPRNLATPQPASSDAELLANIRTTEKLRREALDVQAKREIAEARQAMRNENYREAAERYGLALKLLNDRQSTKGLRKECDQGMAEGLYRAALQEDDLGRRDRAVKLMEKAIDLRHPKARRVLEKWNADGDRVADRTGLADIKHRHHDEDYKMSREQIRRHLRRSRQYLAVRDMKKALEECEVVLVNDPYNQDAIRMREAIQRKRKVILAQEREAARDGMIADVDEAWRPVYAVNAAQLKDVSAETVKVRTGDDPERTMEQDIERRMKEMRLPTISFKPPATIIDAVDFFRGASKDYDRPDIPIEKRGFNFVLKTPVGAIKQQAATEDQSDDFSSNDNAEDGATANGLPPIPTITASDITFYEALKLVCDSVDYKFIVRGPVVMVMQRDMSTAELISRKYNVPEAFIERVNKASDEVKQLKGAGGFGGGNALKSNEGEESQERDWKVFFTRMGVKWPEGSTIEHIPSLGKLYVRNTLENLAEFEKVLDELGATPPLIEIEARFVEVSQEDLNSLGFEWILNSDYTLDVGDRLGKALGIKKGDWGTNSKQFTSTSSRTQDWRQDVPVSDVRTRTDVTSENTTRSLGQSAGNRWGRFDDGVRGVGVNAFGGTDSEYNRANRYLSDVGNHISGANASNNDQFMRVNAFLGNADLSMILHMLSQRSDTDLLSAPKVVTKSGENAVIKVVTEYIYPQDYDVQLQSSSSGSSGSSSGGSQSAILAVVEPQNFTMREVGVILEVQPTYSEANGGSIDLVLKPQVVDEPVWHNYGMRIPFTGNSSMQSFLGLAEIPIQAVNAVNALGRELTAEQTSQYQDAIMASSLNAMNSMNADNAMTWYDAPMEQPFFHVRSLETQVSITPGSTVVMGGLITEARKAMDDKIPFLGDLPFVGRLFRSHAEQTIKRNLLIFVSGRLITPSGRELTLNEETPESTAEVKAAPKAE